MTVALLAALSAIGASDGTAVGRPDRPGAGTMLPDSVLVMVGERPLTRAWFLRAHERATAGSEASTPQDLRGFLDLLVERELLVAAATPDPSPWSAADSARYAAVRDRLTLAAALDSALQGARGDSVTWLSESVGIAARDSAMARMGALLDTAVVARVAGAFAAMPRPTSDSSLAAQIRVLSAVPAFDAGEAATPIARVRGGDDYLVSDLLGAWQRLSPAYRPRIDSPEQVRDLVANGLFERALRRAATGGSFERRPGVAAALDAERGDIAAAHLARREVLDRIAVDDATLRRRHARDPLAWAVPTRVRLMRFDLPDRGAADRMALLLRDPAEADSLEARARRRGISYVETVSAADDSALFAAAVRAPAGTVIGPGQADGGWRVARVLEVLPPRTPDFEEVRDAVRRRWVREESERLTGELVARLRERFPVVYNERAIDAVLREAARNTSRGGPGPGGP